MRKENTMKKEVTYDEARLLVGLFAITDDPEVLAKDPRYILVDDIQDVVEAIVKDGQEDQGDEDIFMFLDRHNIEWE